MNRLAQRRREPARIARGPREGRAMVTLHNVTGSHRVAGGEWPLGGPGRWQDAISGESFDAGSPLQLGPYQALWLEAPQA